MHSEGGDQGLPCHMIQEVGASVTQQIGADMTQKLRKAWHKRLRRDDSVWLTLSYGIGADRVM